MSVWAANWGQALAQGSISGGSIVRSFLGEESRTTFTTKRPICFLLQASPWEISTIFFYPF